MNEFFKPKAVIEGEEAVRARQMVEADLSSDFEARSDFRVESREAPEYIPQIAEPGGLNTCFPTSILNGWVHQGALTTTEAREVQESFKGENSGFFAHRPDLGVDVWTVPAGRLAEAIRSRYGKETRLYTFMINGLDPESLKKVVLQELNKSNLVVGGDDAHAFLVVGYELNGEELVLINPLSPYDEEKIKTFQFAQEIKESAYQFITVIPMNVGQEEAV